MLPATARGDAAVLALDYSKLVHYEPVVVVRFVEVEHPYRDPMPAVRPNDIDGNAVYEIVVAGVVVSDQGNVGGMKELPTCLVDGACVKRRVKPCQGIAQPGFQDYFAKLSTFGKKLTWGDAGTSKDSAAKPIKPGKHGLFEFVFCQHVLLT